MNKQEWQADFAARLMHNEGLRLRMYDDSMGIPTIGCGFNLQRPDWQDGLRAAGVSDFEGVLYGRVALTVDQVAKLLEYSDAPIIPQAREQLQPSHFDAMSDARRAAFADLDFNLGEEGLDEFFGFRGYVDQACHYAIKGFPAMAHEYYAKAAADLLSTGYARQVGVRAQRNAAMLASSTYVAIDAFE